MAYLRLAEARAAGVAARSHVQKSAIRVLREDSQRFAAAARYDVFLSHSYQDADVILGVKSIIQSLDLTVYVDWIDDSELDRSEVSAKTADMLRVRMRASSCLVYAHSANAADSAWMPWELGFFDGFKPKFVWILPLVVNHDSEFVGQEYLGLYPTVDKLATIPGRLNLGFSDVGERGSTVPLAKAAKGHGVFFKTS